MRVMKFRAWDKFNECYWKSKDSLADFFKGAEDLIKSGNELVFEQFTGLHDKNGKEIYEGDVDSHGRVIEYRGGSFHVVQRNGQTFDYLAHMKHITIAGNIHENPELC